MHLLFTFYCYDAVIVFKTIMFLTIIRYCTGGNADYAMDVHPKEQLNDNTMSMMQSQHFSVSLYVYKIENSGLLSFSYIYIYINSGLLSFSYIYF